MIEVPEVPVGLARHYRHLDVGTKVLGLALVSVALDVGIASATGLVLALAGIAVGVCTVFVETDQS